jgi:hypothetical protein
VRSETEREPDYFTAEVPDGPGPSRIEFESDGWIMLLAEREEEQLIPDAWNQGVVYLLLGPAKNPQRQGRVYIGKAPQQGKGRFPDHLYKKDWWRRAVLLHRGHPGMDSTECSWLEAYIFEELTKAGRVELDNKATPREKTLAKRRERSLKRALPLLNSLMKVLGTPLLGEEAPPIVERRTKRKRVIRRLIDSNVLKDGTKLRLRPVGADSMAIQAWLDAEKKRRTVTWRNSAEEPLAWDFDGQTYESAQSLVKKICSEASIPFGIARRGTDWLLTEENESLVELADRVAPV